MNFLKTFKPGLLLFLVLSVVTCTTDSNEIHRATVQLKFEKDEFKISKSPENITIYDVTINSLGEVQLNNDNLELIEAIEENTQKNSFVIIEKESTSSKKGASIQSKGGGSSRGYFFDGECFVYGTMYYGDNGVNLFVPCGLSCIGFDDVCPAWNEAYT